MRTRIHIGLGYIVLSLLAGSIFLWACSDDSPAAGGDGKAKYAMSCLYDRGNDISRCEDDQAICYKTYHGLSCQLKKQQ